MTEELAAAGALDHDDITQPTRPASLAEAAAHFRPFRSQFAARAFAVLPWLALGVAAVVEALVVLGGAGLDLILATGALAVALALRQMGAALNQFPQALAALAERAALRGAGVEARLALFLEASERRFNGRWALAFGVAGAAALAALFWPLNVGTLGEWGEALGRDPRAWLSLLFYAVVYALGFGGGWLVWRPLALALSLARLTRTFEFDLPLDHPDGAGGAGSLGELAWANAAFLVGPGLFFGGWALALSAFDPRSFVGLTEMKLLFGGLGAAGGLLALGLLLWPLWGVARHLRGRSAAVRARLIALDREIHALARQLLEQAENLDPAQGRALDDRLEFLRRVYARNQRATAWAVPGATLVKAMTLQVVTVGGLAAAILTTVLGR
jgi:hypothetical protein